ncbi:MAG: 2-C-methyl-D-erythritol 2,4-cyclodiphosphate synthase [Clostridia bacterium]|nr:2-C-methyl-D-erythritol 2,4-cyclodiphosphate synthase [Clostridia bacterium]
MAEMNGKVSVIICAAGKGERAGFGKNKLLAPLYGAPALYHTLKKFAIPEIDEVAVTSSKEDFKEISALCKPFGFKVVRGGKTRTESVKNALNEISGDIVLIHDGARPFVQKSIILDCIDSVKKFGSGVAAIKFTDTAVFGRLGEITERLDRDSLFRVQTPQGFLTEDIRRAYSLAGDKVYTDDSAVYGDFIAPPRLIEGDEGNVKLTYKTDFKSENPAICCGEFDRAGIGADVHCFGEGNFVTLAGVRIACDKGLIAHSDGDVIFHAVMDAFLSAAGLKDIGHYFPDTSPEFAGADSGKLLLKVMETVKAAGYTAGNVSVTVQAEKPKLAPHIDEMVENLSKICGLPKESCAVAAGTCEHLGFVGEGLGIAAYCVVTLKKITN